ncbi:unnamed protein product [Arabis nemorensis]|uniref:Uncharacterized protein n=1 Tax=Arabis nemorensis TaxID=586526 RepID=A0A565BCB6_9BRAS|nr:unnamed protein product [Arabis nemorensis]
MFSKPPDFGTRPFKFFNMLIKHPTFLDTVKDAWSAAGPVSTNLANFCFKLNSLKKPMKSLCKDNYSDIEKRVFEACVELKSYQLLTLQDPTISNVHNESAARAYWLALRHAEENFFRQRSRIKWMAEGDLNTSFFHFITKGRNAYNAVK